MLVNNDLRRAKEAVEDDLLGIPGVVGVGIGLKERHGQNTDILSIRVFVARKKPLDELGDDERIPPMVEDYSTDVVEAGVIRYLQDTGRYDPLVGGISVGTSGGLPGTGTLGAIVRDNTTGTLGLLSCWHVLVGGVTNTSGLNVTQPAPGDGGISPTDNVGIVTRAVIDENVDCAVARLNFARTPLNAIQDMPPLATIPTMAAQVGWPVSKRGRTTGRTYGTVQDVHLTISITESDGTTRTFKEQIAIWRVKSLNVSFALPGDSGSVVLDDTNRRIIGLLFAASEVGYYSPGARAYANPIDAVLFALGVRIFNPKVKEKEKEGKEEEKDGEKLARKELMIEAGAVFPNEYLSRMYEGVAADAPIQEQMGPLADRLARLEASVDELRHFILESDRPDQV